MNWWILPRLTAAAVITAGVGCAVVVTMDGPFEAAARSRGIGWGVYADVVTVTLLLFVGFLAALVATYARTNLRGQHGTVRFALTLTGVVVAIVVLVAGSNLIIMAVGWTASGLGLTYLLRHPGSPAAVRAARYTRVRLLLGDAFVWTGVLVATAALPSIDRAALTAGTAGATGLVVACLVVGGVIRSSLVPFHRWLPETAEAPSPVSALLHAGLVNGLGIVAVLCWPLFRAAPAVLVALLLLGTLTVVVGTLTARVRADVKGQLACSTSAQMGYMAVQIGLGLPAAALLHLVGHGCYKAWLFLRAGGAVTRSRQQPSLAASPQARQGWWWAATAIGIAAGLSLPAVLQHRAGMTGLVPVALALAAAGIAGFAAARHATTTRQRTGIALLAGLAAAGYLWLLLGWELLLAPSLPLVPVWLDSAAWVMVIVLGVVGVVLARVASGLRPSSSGPLATLLSRSGLPPWTSTVGGRARWPVTGREQLPLPPTASVEDVVSLVATAGTVVSPAWPLREMVAANPLAHLQGMSFETATTMVERMYGVSGYLPLRRYLELFEAGRITEHDLAAALAERGDREDRGGSATSAAELVARSRRASTAAVTPSKPSPGRRWCDRTMPLRGRRGRQVSLAELVDDHAAWWTQRAWARVADQTRGPWQLWRTAAARPVYDLVTGVRGASAWVRELPTDPAAAVAVLLSRTGLTIEGSVGYACRTLTAAPGWAGHAQWRARRLDDPAPLMELFALRVALDVLFTGAVAPTFPQGLDLASGDAETRVEEPNRPSSSLEAVWQHAFEIGVHAPLVAQLVGRPRPEGGGHELAPAAQMVFCIDVRSERLRRHLELSGPVQTFGFAGFFGATVRYQDARGSESEQYPALVKPNAMVRAALPRPTSLRSRMHRAATSVSAAPVAPLLVAEAAGLLAGLAAAAATLAPRRWQALNRRWTRPGGAWAPDRLNIDRSPTVNSSADPLPIGLTEQEMVDIAAGALQAIGLVDTFAPVVVICGHEASAENNAFASAYDCGACGGNSGRINARILAHILNQPTVRSRLLEQGLAIPADTVVIAAVHNTTTDDIDLDPMSTGWTSHHPKLSALRGLIQRATSTTAAERSATLPRRQGPGGAGDVRARSTDWSEPTPEWGLAGNTAMVIGPRHLTSGLDLRGRVFLHSYDVARDDAQHSTLEQLLSAPAVVGHWISAQYYFSTVAPDVFGAGDKTTHNVVGDVGVLTGSHGDVRIGFPWQALFAADPAWDPTSWAHEPVRLLVVVAADPHAVRSVVMRQPGLQQLVVNDWLRIVSLSGEPTTVHQLSRNLVSEPWLADGRLEAAVASESGAA